MSLSDFKLTNIRMLVRNARTILDGSLMVTKGKSPMPHGLWLNYSQMRSMTVEERVKLFGEILEWLE